MSDFEVRALKPQLYIHDLVNVQPMMQTKRPSALWNINFKYSEGGADMGFQTTVKRAELIECIKKNMIEHQSIVEEAMVGYTEQAMKMLNVALDNAMAGRGIDLNFNLNKPESHMGDYARVLKMLEMDIKPEIMLDEQQFANYVMDEWNWKYNFLHTNSRYSRKAMSFMPNARD
jgi:predicted ATPase